MPRSRETFTGVDEFAKAMGLPPAEVRRLRSEGFLAFTVGPIRGPRNTAGLTNAALYESCRTQRRTRLWMVPGDDPRSSEPGVGSLSAIRGHQG